MSAKPKAIEIISVQRTRKTICIHWRQGDGKFELDERDNPLPSFGQAFDALVPIVSSVLHVNETWATDLRVIGLRMGNQGGAQTVQFVCRKSLSDASKEFPFVTPYRLLSHPTEPGSYTEPLKGAHAALVQEAIEQGKSYVRGDRAQGQIDFADGDDADDGETAEEEKARLQQEADELPLAVPAKKKRGKKILA